MRLWRPLRRKRGYRHHGLTDVEVRGLEHVAAATAAGQSVLITPNHPSHADPFALLEASDRLGTPFYFMTAWQVFAMTHRLGRRVLQQHGCFSINREGHDLRAFRFAVDVLKRGERPLVIFPEGEVFHLNDRVTPFRRGAVTAALLAARRAQRQVACIPAGMKFLFVDNPLPDLLELTARLEAALGWSSRSGMSLEQRVRQLIEGIVSLKEVAYLGRPQGGPFRERTTGLIAALLGRLEDRYRLDPADLTVPERVKRLRYHVIQRLENDLLTAAHREQCGRDLDDLFQVSQVFSYPLDYLAGKPSLERLAETLDKLEEDVLGVPTASARGRRRAVVAFGEPIVVTAESPIKPAAEKLTGQLQTRVQSLLDAMNETVEPLPAPLGVTPNLNATRASLDGLIPAA